MPFARVEASSDYVPAPERIKSRFMDIAEGQVGRVTHRMSGFEDGADEPFFTMEYNWLIGDCMYPEGVDPGQYFAITIEGRPSIRVGIDLKASLNSQSRLVDLGKLQTEPGYHGVVAPCLQALPSVVAAGPGLLPSFESAVHWKADFRALEPETSSLRPRPAVTGSSQS